MSFEGVIGIIEAIGKTPAQNPAEIHQPMQMASEGNLAQAFESGLIRASETSAATLQPSEDVRRRAVQLSARDGLKPSETHIEVGPADNHGSLGKGIASYMEGFESRTSKYPSELDEFVSKLAGGTTETGIAGGEGSSSGIGDKESMFHASDALHVLERSFQFAIEAELVSNTSKHSTQVFNDLMKGQ